MSSGSKLSVSKESTELPEVATKSSQEKNTSHIPIPCFCSSNSSLDSLEPSPKGSKISHQGEDSTSGLPFITPSYLKSSNSTYTLNLEKEYDSLQMAFFALTTHFAKVQFRLRQIMQAKPCERDRLLAELIQVAFCEIDEIKLTNMPNMKKDLEYLGNIRRRQGHLIDRLRCQLESLSQHDICEENQQVTRRKSVRIDDSVKEFFEK